MEPKQEANIIVPTAVGQLTLDNGLTVVWEEDHRQPLVAVEVRILGGLRGERSFLGSGITHFLEHMLFKGTPTRPPGTIEQEVRRYGGTINASTSHDYTAVSLFVESRFLPDALALLADILQHATFPTEEFTKERAVIFSEIQMNHDDPERRIRDLFWNHHFLVHPYRHPILGYQQLLERLTVEDLRALYQAQYVPNNIVMVCAGDLDPTAFAQLVQETFGSWVRGSPYQVVIPEEPQAASRKQAFEELPIHAAYLIVGFPSVRLADPDLYPLDVLANVVGQGQSARLYVELVRNKRLAQAVGASNYTPFDPGAFTVSLRTGPDHVPTAIEAALEVLEEVKRNGISDEELQKAKRQVAADYVFRHQTIESKADDLASSLALTGDPAFSKRYVEGIRQVTPDQVKQVARRYLDQARMTLAVIQPAGAQASAPPRVVSHPLTVHKTLLPNGLTVLLGTDPHLPMGVIVVASRGGVRVETEETQGLSNLVSQLLVKGTRHKTAQDVAILVESLGGVLDAFSGRDGFGLSLQMLAEDLDEGLALIHELITESTFLGEELSLQRQLILKDLEARDDDIFDVGSRLLRKTLFTTHPYRFDPMGSKEAIQRLGRADCLAFAKQRLVPRNMVLAVLGDFQEETVLKEIQRQFSSLPDEAVPWPQTLEAEQLDGIRQASWTLPKEQSLILFGFRGTRIVAQDRYSLDVLTAVLSGMSGRLFQAVRERQGLSYTLGAAHVPGWDPGYIIVYAATRPSERDQVQSLLQEQLQAVIDAGVSKEELEEAKRYLIGIHRLDLQHLLGLARRSCLDELYGLGYDAWTQYEDRINAVTIPMVQEVARQYLRLSQRAQVVIAPDLAPQRVQGHESGVVHDDR